MSYPQRSYYSSNDNIKQNLSMVESLYITSPNKQQQNNNKNSINITKFPQCFYHSKPIKYLCMSQTCKSKYYTICSHEQCKQIHSHPQLNIIQIQRFQQYKQKHLKSINLLKNKINLYQKQLIDQVVHKIVKDFQMVKNVIDKFYMNTAAKKISQGQYQSLNSKQLYEFINKSNILQTKLSTSDNQGLQFSFIQSKNMIIDTMNKLKQSIKKLTQSKQYRVITLQQVIIQNYESHSNINGSPIKSHIKKQSFNSKIIQFQQQYQCLIKMLRQNRYSSFQQFKLLYRGSQHQFSSKVYHQKVDNKIPLFLIILTQQGRKFGAFINCKTIINNQWISDPTGLSFIFSLDHNQTYRIKPSAHYRTKAIFGCDKGPTIGSGCDIYITDKCNTNYQSGSNFGGSYQLPFGLDFNTKKAKQYLAGKQNFLVTQYQVFMLI